MKLLIFSTASFFAITLLTSCSGQSHASTTAMPAQSYGDTYTGHTPVNYDPPGTAASSRTCGPTG